LVQLNGIEVDAASALHFEQAQRARPLGWDGLLPIIASIQALEDFTC
jgi:hypothetical protein